jgi:hypothetical protein
MPTPRLARRPGLTRPSARQRLALFAAIGLGIAGAGPALGETRIIQSSGLWNAYGGTDDDGRAVCGISTSGADGRRIAVQQSAGETDLDLVLEKPSWAIPDNTPIDLAIQFDNAQAFPDHATGAGNRVTLRLPFDRSIPFMRSLRGRSQVRVYFPSGNEVAWTGGLGGSSAAIDAFNDCRAALAPAGPSQGPSQPYAAPASPTSPTSPTQPFPTRP